MEATRFITRTCLSSEDLSSGIDAAQSLAKTILGLCNSSKTNFEDPDFGPQLSERGAELEIDINTALKKQLPDRTYTTIAKTFKKAESQRSKCLQNIVGPSGKIQAADLSWLSNDPSTSFVVSDQATPSFPVQGSVGDCWLLGAMSMVAVTRPRLLQEIFVCPTGDWLASDKKARYGMIPISSRDLYVVRLFHELKWHYVVIDGRVPRGHSGRPTFGRCSDSNEMWVSLVEKAAAKLVGGYDKLHLAATVDFGLHLLTGCSTHTIRGGGFRVGSSSGTAVGGGGGGGSGGGGGGGGGSNSESKMGGGNAALPETLPQRQQQLIQRESSKETRAALWTQIQRFVNAGFVVGFERQERIGQSQDSRKKSPSARSAFTDEDGLLIRHAYTIVDVGEIRGTKLVRVISPWMVNPWPTGHYHGAWDRDSEEMEENINAVASTFSERVRREDGTNTFSQYVPSFSDRRASNGSGSGSGGSDGSGDDENMSGDDDDASESEAALDSSTSRYPCDFLLPFDHVFDTMSHVHVGFIAPLSKKNWTLETIHGKWSAKVGGCAAPGIDLSKWSRNPRYLLDIPESDVSAAELERRKRSQVNPKTTVTNIVVAVRQSLKLNGASTSEKNILGMRFVPRGTTDVPSVIEKTIPGRAQPYHVGGTSAASVSLDVRTSSTMDVVPDNYGVGRIAEFVLTVIAYKSKVGLKKTMVSSAGAESKTTNTKVGVVVDGSAPSAKYDNRAIPNDRKLPSENNVMRVIRKKRERDQARIVTLEKRMMQSQPMIVGGGDANSVGESKTANASRSGRGGGAAAPAYGAPPEVQFEQSLDFWKKKRSTPRSGGGDSKRSSSGRSGKSDGRGRPPPPSYASVQQKKEQKNSMDDDDSGNALPPPPPYTRVVVSPERAKLRARIQQNLLDDDNSMGGGGGGGGGVRRDYFGAVVDPEEDSHCAVVFRGGLMMRTIDLSPAMKKKRKAKKKERNKNKNKFSSSQRDDIDSSEDEDEEKNDEADNAFILCTVQEIVTPYALIFSVEHPGSRTSATRRLDLKNLEQILTSPLSYASTMSINPESITAVEQWFDDGILPRHDHLATWLGAQMELDLGGGGIHVQAIDGPAYGSDDGDSNDEADDMNLHQELVLHDVVGAEQPSVASSWEDENEEMDEEMERMMRGGGGGGDQSFAPVNSQGGGAGGAGGADDGTDEWGFGGGDENMPSESGSHDQPTSGAKLPDSDPFVLASLHAGAVLKELQDQDQYRKRVAKVREEVILERSRRLRAATEYKRDISRLQHKEIGKAIMSQTVAIGVAGTLKKSDVQDEKRKRDLRRLTNPFKHNPSEKWIRGPNLGEGPLPSRTLDQPRRQKRLQRERSKYAYDDHGRLLPKTKLGKKRTGPPVEAVMTAMRNAARGNSMEHMDVRDLFNQYDVDNNGYLSKKEMKLALLSLGVKLTPEEIESLCVHFDANQNGKIHYSEFAFAFFNRRGLINKWRMIRGPGMRSEAAINSMFRKYDYDGSGKLEKDEFERCLGDMGIVLPSLEFQILCERFDEDGDGFVQPVEFMKFMKSLEESDSKQRKEHRQNVTNSLLNNVRKEAEAAGGKLSTGDVVHPDIAALRAKIQAQEEEMETLEKFMSRRK